MLPENDWVLSETAFAKKIGLSLVTVRRMRRRGEIEYIQLSEHRIGYRDSYAEKLLDARTVKAVQP
jgi:predicted site-specific integrase-resolvase